MLEHAHLFPKKRESLALVLALVKQFRALPLSRYPVT
jgi:hypothetical protein